MSWNASTAAFAAQSAFFELLEVVQQIAPSDMHGEQLRDEAEKTTLMLIAAIVLADGVYRDGEKGLLALLVDWKAKPGGEARYLNEYAAKWAEQSTRIPDFIKTAAAHDVRHETETARAMLRQIQLIGNWPCPDLVDRCWVSV